ncbi:hypothetical protein [Aquimarina aquimarini]|uniref:hypothetical protein n=1 Tax=Aquimarina aquimarini TaxID=1191734 RepID=UPI00131F3581|nr:hypothetical protein [Aquimarina aquimarini]
MDIKLLLITFLFCLPAITYGQDLNRIGKAKLFTLTGGVAANSIFYNGQSAREPFTYFLSGNINLNISGVYTIPVSFSYSNQKFQSSNPFSFNRLSIHPSYKWITTHIGDVSMTFSPYTLSGHQFTGLGVDLAPDKPYKISAMYGRLLKESEYNPDDPQSVPAYKRMGYGIKASYGFEKFSVGAIFFKAIDDKKSITKPVPVEQELHPKENVVVSFEGSVKLFDKGEIRAEVATSSITENSNAESKEETSTVLSTLLNNNATTQHYKAYNVNFFYPVGQGTIGVGYEYIDPEYRTLGAYFFNNDLENITLNATQNLFQNKVNITFNAGLQKDDLDNTKSTQLQRVVSAVTIGYNASEKLSITGGYSNFQSFTNIKNQFDYINEVSQGDNLDTLDFQQISQNANLTANYSIKDTETQKQNFTIGLSFQNAVNKQNEQIVENGDSNFYNANTSYSLGYPVNNINVAAAVNISYNTIGIDNSLTYGPMVTINKKYFDKKLRTTASISYNQSMSNNTKQGDVTNIRLGSTYTYKKKHNFNLNLLTQFRNTTNSSTDFTATFGYNYTFDKFNPQLKFPKRKKRKVPDRIKRNTKTNNKQQLQFKYRGAMYQGTMDEIDTQLATIQNHSQFDHIPRYKKEELTMLRLAAADERKIEKYKSKAITFLKELYSYEDFLSGYNQLVFDILVELRKDMLRLDYAFEKAFVKAKIAVDNHRLHGSTKEELATATPELKNRYTELQQNATNALARLIGHRWTLPIIKSYTTISAIEHPDAHLKEVMEQEKDIIFRMVDKKEDQQKLKLYMITKIIDFYLKKSLNYTNPDTFNLRYIEKN